jgi:hypothetical protein
MIRYKERTNSNNEPVLVTVLSDGKVAGTIEKERYGWRYHAKGSGRFQGELYPTLQEVKKSLEGD